MTRDDLIEKLTNATDDGETNVSVLHTSTDEMTEIAGIKGEVGTDGKTTLYVVTD